jgi:hypothetical protein
VCKVHGPLKVNEYYAVDRQRTQPSYNCKKCQQTWQENNREKVRESCRKSFKSLRLEVLLAYSPTLCCAICSENHYESLALDHVDGGGTTHRHSCGQYKLWNDLRRQGFPAGFRVLCHNCNWKHGARSEVNLGVPRKNLSDLSQNPSTIRNRRYIEAHPERIKARSKATHRAMLAKGFYGSRPHTHEKRVAA